jgi:membrane fusion protein, copper/silver efflux system
MKTKVAIVLISLLVNAGGLWAQHHSTGEAHTETKKGAQTAVPAAFQKQLASVFTAYTSLKNDLVASDATKAKKSAASVGQSLQKVDMKLLKGTAHTEWMKALQSMNNHLSLLSKASTIEEQRKHFAPFSEAMHHSIKNFGIGEQEAYYQHCPMANNSKGAYWLSESKEIKNPYFGEKMLKCGDTLRGISNQNFNLPIR